MTDERDPLDETLARGLRGLAPSDFELDAEQALGSMRPALHRARARRRLTVATSALGVLAVVVVGAAMLRQEPAGRIDIRGRPRPTTPTLVRPSTTTASTSTTTPGSTPETTINRTPSTTAPNSPDGGSGPTVTTPITTKTTTPGRGETTTTVPATAPKIYGALGGRATITFSGGRLALVSYAPTAGYQSDVRTNTVTEIEIRFSNGDAESRIRIRVQDGQLRSEVTEH